ncbi:BolA family transcriptional regulator [Ferrovum sp.]|uniref:BolA family protein n=1 Tax=Ferrovum sp. TaxID=2609467 RepID=UPI002633FB0E|nr:BolA family protein [Ferrovum sp.]
MTSTAERIRACLAPLSPLILEIQDDSAQHHGHPGARAGGGHYRVRIVAETFRHRSRLEAHRMVHSALNSLMNKEIHALQLDVQSP